MRTRRTTPTAAGSSPPLKDRFGAEIRTHYPLEIADEVKVIRQEANLVAEVPDA